MRTLEGHSQGICDLAWTTDGAYLASASDDTTIRIWDVATVSAGLQRFADTNMCVTHHLQAKPACKALRGHTNYVYCVDFSPRCNILASGSYDESLRIWDLRSGKPIRVIPSHSEPLTSTKFNGDGTVIMTSSYDGLV